jgi:hypothetical protein
VCGRGDDGLPRKRSLGVFDRPLAATDALLLSSEAGLQP